jgi:hypothetical protein
MIASAKRQASFGRFMAMKLVLFDQFEADPAEVQVVTHDFLSPKVLRQRTIAAVIAR